MNSSVLNSSNILAFSIITEQTLRGTPVADIQAAANLVKQRYPDIRTMAVDSAPEFLQAYYRGTFSFPSNLDWVGVFQYYIRPNVNFNFKDSINILKSRKQSGQRIVYVMDGFYSDLHTSIAPTIYDMDKIAQEWYLIASQDPEAILLGVFIWPDVPGENITGSANFDQRKQIDIGRAILAGKVPTYQSTLDINCGMTVARGWALDASVPNSWLYVDLLIDDQLISTQQASRYSWETGWHGFLFNYVSYTQNHTGQPHQIAVRYSGTTTLLPGSPKTCVW